MFLLRLGTLRLVRATKGKPLFVGFLYFDSLFPGKPLFVGFLYFDSLRKFPSLLCGKIIFVANKQFRLFPVTFLSRELTISHVAPKMFGEGADQRHGDAELADVCLPSAQRGVRAPNEGGLVGFWGALSMLHGTTGFLLEDNSMAVDRRVSPFGGCCKEKPKGSNCHFKGGTPLF